MILNSCYSHRGGVWLSDPLAVYKAVRPKNWKSFTEPEEEFIQVTVVSPRDENGYLAFEVDLVGSWYPYTYGIGVNGGGGRVPSREWKKDEVTIKPGEKNSSYFLDDKMHLFCRELCVANDASKFYGFRLATHSGVTSAQSRWTIAGGSDASTFKSWNIVEIKAKMSQPETFDVGNLFLTLPMLRFVTLIDGTGKRNVFIRF